MAPSLPLKFSPEVADALADGRPVVALESTIIAHGLPYPENAETAQLLEQTIRDRGPYQRPSLSLTGGNSRAYARTCLYS